MPRPAAISATRRRAAARPAALRRERAGIALVLVMVLLTVMLALSYAMLRSQSTSLAIERNASRSDLARHAAQTGLGIALETMHDEARWAGVGTSFGRPLSADSGFSIQYSAGDPALTDTHADWNDLPYRVTVTSTGYATDPEFVSSTSTYVIEAVVRLAPRALAAGPSEWDSMQSHTIYQVEDDEFNIEAPTRIEGPVRTAGTVHLLDDAPDDEDARDAYFKDLKRMYDDSFGDYRPFSGTVTLDLNGNLDAISRLVSGGMSVNTATPATVDDAWRVMQDSEDYQLYPGGPTYSMQAVGSNVQNATLEADPETNPLGLFYRNGDLTLGSNATVAGSLLVKGRLMIGGTNITISAINMPPLVSSSSAIQLPVVICDDLWIGIDTTGSIHGMVSVADEFRLYESSESAAFDFTGRMVTGGRFRVEARSQWLATNWAFYYSTYESMVISGGSPYFPVVVKQAAGRDYNPVLTFQPDPNSVTYHRTDGLSEPPVYATDPNDAGVYWDLVSRRDNP